MLPVTEPTTGREPVKYDLDTLLSDLNQPKEEITNHQPGQQSNGVNQQPGATNQQPTEELEPMPAEVAALSGKVIAGTIDTTLSTALSLYAKNNDPDKYAAKEKQIQQLNLAWAAVAQKYNYRIEDSPWFNVGLLSVAVYLPAFQEAKKDRRFAEVDEKLKEMQRQLQEQKTRLDLINTQTAATQ